MFRIVAAYAKRNKLSMIHPSEKLLLTIIPIIVIALSKQPIPIMINIVFFIGLHIYAKNPMKIITKFVGGILIFSLVSSFTFVFDYGYYYCLVLILKTLSGGIVITYLSFTTPLDDMLVFLARVEFLRDICDIIKSMERFLILIEDEFKIIINAMKIRGGFDTKKGLVINSGKVAGVLFNNTLRRWKDIKDGINSRCYKGQLHYSSKGFSSSKLRKFGITLYILVLAVLVYRL